MSDLGRMFGETLARLVKDFQATAENDQGVGPSWSRALWQGAHELGLPLALVPESQGGVGCEPGDLFEILRLAGRAAPPFPLTEPLLAGWLLGEAGASAGSGLITTAIPVPDDAMVAEVIGETLHFSGTLAQVPWGRHAQGVVAIFLDGASEIVAPLPVASAQVEEGQNIAGEPLDRLHFASTIIPLAGCRVETGKAWREALWHYGALCRSAQMVGAMEGVLEMTLNYVEERHQFGRPLKKFQVIQQYLAVMAGEIAAAAMATKMAFASESPWQHTFQVAAAKARVGEAVAQVAAIAHQVHGAMGYAAEYSLGRYTKRLWAWRDEYGSELAWQERLGWLLVDSKQASLWELLTELDI